MVEQGTKATDTQQLSQSREAVHERFSQDTPVSYTHLTLPTIA